MSSSMLKAVVCMAMMIAGQTVHGLAPLQSIESDLSLLESEASQAPRSSEPSSTSDSILAAARKYADEKIADAVAQSKELLKQTVQEEADKALQVQKELDSTKVDQFKIEPVQLPQPVAQAPKKKSKIPSEVLSAIKQRREDERALKRLKKRTRVKKSVFKSGSLRPNRMGVYGAVILGLPKATSGPSNITPKANKNNKHKYALGERKSARKLKRSCLKDIAAHYDEQDIYEQRLLSLREKIAATNNKKYVAKLKQQLVLLEKYHQTMQRKFMAPRTWPKSVTVGGRITKPTGFTFSSELLAKIASNKAARKAGLPVPFPEARALAMKELKVQKVARARLEKQIAMSHKPGKKVVIPTIDNEDFPDRDQISAIIRERQWRRIETEPQLSTQKKHLEDSADMIVSENKRHDDFIHSETARPFIKRIHHARVPEPLKPHFLVNFPWQKKVDKVHIDSKIKVPQEHFKLW